MSSHSWSMAMLFASTLAACADDKDASGEGEGEGEGETGDETGDETGTETGIEDCEILISETWPARGDSDFYYRAALEIYFTSRPPGGVTTTLTGPSGELPTSPFWDEDEQALFLTPDEPLEPATDYTLDIHYCYGDPSISFSTSEVGAPVDPDELVGRVYRLMTIEGRFREPLGIGAILGELIGRDPLILVTSADDDSVSMLAGFGADQQNTCIPTTAYTADFTENPAFMGEAVEPVMSEGVTLALPTIIERYGAAFSPDGRYTAGGEVVGQVDARTMARIPDVAALAGCEEGDSDCLCEFIAGTGFAVCEACSDGEPACLPLWVDGLVGVEEDLEIQAVEESNCHPDCDESYDNPDCDTSSW